MERCSVKRKSLKLSIAAVVAAVITSFVPPTYTYAAANEALPKIYGASAVTIDMQTNEIIYAKGIDEKRYPASTTKLMTGLLLAENKKSSDLLKYTQSAKSQPPYSINDSFKPMAIGETMKAEDVMKALLLFSANDSAYIIADNVGGNVTNFINMMNERAQKLGMKNTHFVTANGLHDDNHYSTAYDMSLIGREAFKNPWVKQVLGIKNDKIYFQNGTYANIDTRNKYLGKNGNIGAKTGYTKPAGRCLVAFYERDGRQIMGVVMNSLYVDDNDTYVFDDMEKIINWSYSAKPTTVVQKDTIVKTEEISYKPFKFFGPTKTVKVPILLKDNITYYENEVNSKEVQKSEPQLVKLDAWNLSKDNKIGTITVKQREITKTYDLYPTIDTKEIKDLNKNLYILSGISAGVVFVVVIAAIVLIISKIGRRQRRYR